MKSPRNPRPYLRDVLDSIERILLRCRRRPRRSLRAAIGAQEMALRPATNSSTPANVIGARRVNTLEQARLRLHAIAGLPVKPIEAGEFALQGSHGPGHVAD